MRARVAGVFLLGCVVGALLMVVGLWWAGALKPAAIAQQRPPLPAAVAQERPPLPAAPGPLAAVESANRDRPGGLTADPSQLPQDLQAAPGEPARGEAPRGEADRVNTEGAGMPHLRVPVSGVAVGSLRDTFHDARDGHAHEALDIPAPRGTPVVAAAEGNVAKLFKSKPGGLTVYQFDNSRTYCYYYAHLDRYAAGLREGVLLRPGDVLGYVGTTGDAPPNAPHLHFAVFRLGPEKQWWKGTAIDPLPLIRER